jgi:hypothetical protein
MATLPSARQPTAWVELAFTATPRISDASSAGVPVHIVFNGACLPMYSLYQSTNSFGALWSHCDTLSARLPPLRRPREGLLGVSERDSPPNAPVRASRLIVAELGAFSKHLFRQRELSRATFSSLRATRCKETMSCGSRTITRQFCSNVSPTYPQSSIEAHISSGKFAEPISRVQG